MEITIGKNAPSAPEPEKKKTFQVLQSKGELHTYISQTSKGEVQSMHTHTVVSQQTVGVDFLNQLAIQGEMGSLEKFLNTAKQSMLFLGLVRILKGVSSESALVVIDKLDSIPPKAPFELFKSYAAEPTACLAIIEKLMKKGWSPTSRNDSNETLLDMAVKLGHTPESPLYKGLIQLGFK